MLCHFLDYSLIIARSDGSKVPSSNPREERYTFVSYWRIPWLLGDVSFSLSDRMSSISSWSWLTLVVKSFGLAPDPAFSINWLFQMDEVGTSFSAAAPNWNVLGNFCAGFGMVLLRLTVDVVSNWYVCPDFSIMFEKDSLRLIINVASLRLLWMSKILSPQYLASSAKDTTSWWRVAILIKYLD